MKTPNRIAIALATGLMTSSLFAQTYTYTTKVTDTDFFGQSYEIDVDWVFEDAVVDGKAGVRIVSISEDLSYFLGQQFKIPEYIVFNKRHLPVIELGDNIFAGWDMESYTVPNHILKIGDSVFEDCYYLADVDLGTYLRHVGKHPFINTAVEEISLPDSLLEMDGNIAMGTIYGAQVTISDNSHFEYSDDGLCLFNKDKTRLYCCQTRAEDTVSLPPTLTEIMPNAFFGCFRLTNLTIPASVISIGSKAFNVTGIWPNVSAPESAARLKSVLFVGTDPDAINAASDIYSGAPEDLVTYASGSLWTAKGNTWKGRALSVDEPPTVSQGFEIIDDLEWQYNMLSDGTVTIASVKSTTGSTIFSLVFPDMLGNSLVTGIGTAALANLRGLTSVSIPSTYTAIGDYAFTNCTALASVTIPSGVRTIGKAPFAGTAITSLTIPNTVTSLDGNPIVGCAFLTGLSVAAGNTSFAASDGMLFDADKTELLACVPSATAVTLPDTLAAIADDAFAGCTRLTKVTALCEVPVADDGIYADTPANLVTCADIYSLTSWQEYEDWYWNFREFENTGKPDPAGIQTYTDGNGVTWYYTVRNRKVVLGVTTPAVSTATSGAVSIPETIAVEGIGDLPVVEVGASAFVNCKSVTKITIPASVTNIVAGAFNGCSALEAFAVASGNGDYAAFNGALYSKDGTCLVKIPACFRFPTTVTAKTKTTVQQIKQVLEYYENGLPKAYVFEPVGNPVTSNATVVSTYTPVLGLDQMLVTVVRIADYAFCDCGTLPTGSSFAGSLTVVKDGVKQSETIGTFTVTAGTDATNTVTTTTGQTGDIIWVDGLPRGVSVSITTSATYSKKVPVPTIPSSVFCPKMAWYGSVWYDQIPEDILPPLGSDAAAADVAKVLGDFADTALAANITSVAAYEDFRIWAMTVRNAAGTELAGFDAVAANEHVWQAFALDLDALLANELNAGDVKTCNKLELGENGEIAYSITLVGRHIGSGATPENLRRIFKVEGTADLAKPFSEDNVDVTFGTPSNGRVKLIVEPVTVPAGAFFINLGIRK